MTIVKLFIKVGWDRWDFWENIAHFSALLGGFEMSFPIIQPLDPAPDRPHHRKFLVFFFVTMQSRIAASDIA